MDTMKSEIKKINIIFVKKVNDGIYSFNAGMVVEIAIDAKYLNYQPAEIINSTLDAKTQFLLLQIINKNAKIKEEAK